MQGGITADSVAVAVAVAAAADIVAWQRTIWSERERWCL